MSASSNHRSTWTTRTVLRHALAAERRWVKLAFSTALLMGHQIGEAAVPVLIGLIVDEAIAPGDGGFLAIGVGLLAAVFVAFSWSYRIGARVLVDFMQGAEHDLRQRLVQRELDPRGVAGPPRPPGDQMTVATSDAERVSELGEGIAVAGAGAAAFIFAAIALLSVSLTLGLLVLLGTPPLVLLMSRLGGPLERRSGIEQEQSARAGAVAADLVGGLRVLKGIGAQRAAAVRYAAASQTSLAATLRAARARAVYQGLMTLMAGTFLVVVAYVAGHQTSSGQISVGDLIAVVGLAQFLQGPLRRIGYVGIALAQARGSAERVAAVLRTDARINEGADQAPRGGTGTVRLDAVTTEALRGLSLTVRAGDCVGIATSDNTAAESLLATLGRTDDPATGAIYLDGVDLRTVDPDSLRENAVVLRHDAVLFDGSIRSNVAAAGADDDAVDAAIRAANADEVLSSIGTRSEDSLGEQGRSLSGGQRQRVGLARALATKARLLVLHDPTTAVDSVTEARIARGLVDLRRGRTTILVTTSPTLLAACSAVHFIHNGRLEATGTHQDLAADNADYRAAVLS